MARPKRRSRHDYERQHFTHRRGPLVLDDNFIRLETMMDALQQFLVEAGDEKSVFNLATPIDNIEVHFAPDPRQVTLVVKCERGRGQRFVHNAPEIEDDADEVDLGEDEREFPDAGAESGQAVQPDPDGDDR